MRERDLADYFHQVLSTYEAVLTASSPPEIDQLSEFASKVVGSMKLQEWIQINRRAFSVLPLSFLDWVQQESKGYLEMELSQVAAADKGIMPYLAMADPWQLWLNEIVGTTWHEWTPAQATNIIYFLNSLKDPLRRFYPEARDWVDKHVPDGSYQFRDMYNELTLAAKESSDHAWAYFGHERARGVLGALNNEDIRPAIVNALREYWEANPHKPFAPPQWLNLLIALADKYLGETEQNNFFDGNGGTVAEVTFGLLKKFFADERLTSKDVSMGHFFQITSLDRFFALTASEWWWNVLEDAKGWIVDIGGGLGLSGVVLGMLGIDRPYVLIDSAPDLTRSLCLKAEYTMGTGDPRVPFSQLYDLLSKAREEIPMGYVEGYWPTVASKLGVDSVASFPLGESFAGEAETLKKELRETAELPVTIFAERSILLYLHGAELHEAIETVISMLMERTGTAVLTYGYSGGSQLVVSMTIEVNAERQVRISRLQHTRPIQAAEYDHESDYFLGLKKSYEHPLMGGLYAYRGLFVSKPRDLMRQSLSNFFQRLLAIAWGMTESRRDIVTMAELLSYLLVGDESHWLYWMESDNKSDQDQDLDYQGKGYEKYSRIINKLKLWWHEFIKSDEDDVARLLILKRLEIVTRLASSVYKQ